MLESALDRFQRGTKDPGIIEMAREFIDRIWQKDPAAMISLEWKIFRALERRLPTDHPDVLKAHLSSVSAYMLAGDTDRACKLGEHVLQDFQKVFGYRASATVWACLARRFLERKPCTEQDRLQWRYRRASRWMEPPQSERACTGGRNVPADRRACQLTIAVGTPVARCPPHGPGRALISASGSYLG